jgi:hypothetical protein
VSSTSTRASRATRRAARRLSSSSATSRSSRGGRHDQRLGYRREAALPRGEGRPEPDVEDHLKSATTTTASSPTSSTYDGSCSERASCRLSIRDFGSLARLRGMPKVGIEPTRPEGHRILSPARLPVPPLRRCLDRSLTSSRRFAPAPKAGLAGREAHDGSGSPSDEEGGPRGKHGFIRAVEPTRLEGHRILSPARLPVSPLRRVENDRSPIAPPPGAAEGMDSRLLKGVKSARRSKRRCWETASADDD